MITAAFKDRDIEARGAGQAGRGRTTSCLAALAKMIRQREESAKAFDDGGRPELAAKERAEIEVIRGFMPKQMDEAEVGGRGRARRSPRPARPRVRDMGKVMAVLKARHAGEMDFGKASALVKSKLG